MGRPKDADSARTYDAIVAAAHELMSGEDAPTAPSLRAVARRSGFSPGTIQYYFESKEDLLEACLDRYYEQIASIAGELLAQPLLPEHAGAIVEGGVRRLYRFLREHRGLLKLRLMTNARRGELHPRRQDEFMGMLLDAAVKQAAPLIEVSPLDARLSIQAISAFIARYALLSDAEVERLTGLEGQAARDAVEDFVGRAGRRLIRPTDG